MERFCELKPYVDQYLFENDIGITLDEQDWTWLFEYKDTVVGFVEAVTLMSGEQYPTASSVIPVIDSMFDSLEKRDDALREMPAMIAIPGWRFHDALAESLKKRFPDGKKTVEPLNFLTLLDRRYQDVYFTDKRQRLSEILRRIKCLKKRILTMLTILRSLNLLGRSIVSGLIPGERN